MNQLSAVVFGHSQVRGLKFRESPDLTIKKVYRPGATVRSLRNGICFSHLAAASPDVVVLFIGGNDISAEVKVSELYQQITELVNSITFTLSPAFGVFVIEPEKRTNPRGVSAALYGMVRNSLVRMIKKRAEIKLFSLHTLGIINTVCF